MADVLLNCIDDHAHELDEIVQARVDREMVDSPIFGRRVRPIPEPRASVMLRGLTQHQRTQITREAKHRGVKTPFLVTAVLDHALPPA